MLDISILKLTARAQKQVLTDKNRLGINKRHYILQLVTKTEGAA
jgi:hypothetical protein